MNRSEDVLRFWLEECEPGQWYSQEDALDADIRARFLGIWEAAAAGGLQDWTTSPRGTLAYLILTDQLPRNMFRGEARAFATDPMARAAAKRGIKRGFDLRIAPPARQFFYLPLEHSECGADQERAVRLVLTRLEAADTLLHARVHREIIRRFGRFPFRNAALGRVNSAAETAFLEGGGYGPLLRQMQVEAA